MKKMNILAIGAHPDDIEFGCGGALIKYADRGHRIYLMVMTEGDLGAPKPTRKDEQLDSRAILGVKDIFWGNYEDTYLEADKDIISEIEHVIADVKPDYLLSLSG